MGWDGVTLTVTDSGCVLCVAVGIVWAEKDSFEDKKNTFLSFMRRGSFRRSVWHHILSQSLTSSQLTGSPVLSIGHLESGCGERGNCVPAPAQRCVGWSTLHELGRTWQCKASA